MEAAEPEPDIQSEDTGPSTAPAHAAKGDPWHWWLRTRWLRHRHEIGAVHPLLMALQDARGTGFMTPEHIAAVLDAKNPDGLVREWIQAAPTAAGPQGNPETLPVVADA